MRVGVGETHAGANSQMRTNRTVGSPSLIITILPSFSESTACT